MNTRIKKPTVIVSLVLVVFLLAGAWSPACAATGSVLPAGVSVSDTFKPGFGPPIGNVQRVRGEVVVMHAEDAGAGYRARPGLPLYRGDTLLTLKDGKIRFRLNDGSIMSLASETSLELNKSVYDKEKKSRSSFMNLAFGKARFLVVKLLNFKRSEFKVKTPTAVCGVRGSDFVLEATEQVTVATALEATSIEIANPMFPDVEPIVLNEYETSRVYVDGYPSDPIRLSPEEIQRVKEPFISVNPEDSNPEAGEIQAGGAIDVIAAADVQILVPEDAIVDLPEEFELKEVGGEDIFKTVDQSGITREKPSVIRSEVMEEIKDGYLGDLPDFPDMPE